jgi:alanyl-tRNA synthetase
MLGQCEVADVREDGGKIVHYVKAGCLQIGARVNGKVDMERRLDHSTTHTAQHILSAIAEKMLGAKTIGFHLGRHAATVDLDIAGIEKTELKDLERLANEAVTQNLPITISCEDPRPEVSFRTKKEIRQGEPLRIVAIGDLDRCACCGTHLSRSGQVGAIKLGKTERVRKSVRLEFFAGNRVLAEFGRLQAMADELSRITGSGMSELVDFFKAADDELKRLRRENEELCKRLAHVEAQSLLEEAKEFCGGKLIAAVVSQREPKNLRTLAMVFRNKPGVAALLGAVWQDEPHLVFARSEGMELDMSVLLKSALTSLGGRGGGRPDMAQGGGGDPLRLEAILDDIAKSLLQK